MGESERVLGSDVFERLPDSLLLHLFSYLPTPTDQQHIGQTCRRFRDLAKQIPILHLISNSDNPNLLNVIDKAIGAREENTLRELVVEVDQLVVPDQAICRWLVNCCSSLEVLQVQDDFEENSRTTHLDQRLVSASLCTNLKSLKLSGSSNSPLEPSLVSCRFVCLQELALDRVITESNEVLQSLVASCPKLQVLHLLEVGPLTEIRISSTSLKTFFISRSTHELLESPMNGVEKFAKVLLITPELERASISDVSKHVEIQSGKLQGLTLHGTATCKVVVQDWSNLVALDIQADRSDAASPARWSMDDVLSLVSSVTSKLKSIRIVLWSRRSIKGACPEKLWQFFGKIGSVKKAVFSTHFLSQNGLAQEADHFKEQKKLFDRGVFDGLLEVTLFFDEKAQLSHQAYVDFFLNMCLKLARLIFDCTEARGIEGDFIRLILAYQKDHPSLEMDFGFPETLQNPNADTDDESEGASDAD